LAHTWVAGGDAGLGSATELQGQSVCWSYNGWSDDRFSFFLMLLVMFVIIMYVPLSACRIPNVAVVNVKWLATVVPGARVSRTLQEQC